MNEPSIDPGERIIFRYEVQLDSIKAFEKAYGAGGEWDMFFAGAPGYARTELYRDVEAPNVYLTIDYWSQLGQRDAYVASRQDEYDALDAKCAKLTVDERRI